MADGHQIAINDKVDTDLGQKVMEISVEQAVDQPTKFRVKFAVDICDGQLTYVEDKRLTPGPPDRFISIYSTVRDTRFCLVRGIITKRKVSLTHGGPGSWIEVSGQDRTLELTRKITTATFKGSAGDTAQGILSRYSFQKYDVQVDGRDYKQLNQTKSDYDFLTKLAANNKASLWIDYDIDDSGKVKETINFRPSPVRDKASSGLPVKLTPDTSITLSINRRDDCISMTSFEVEADNEVPQTTGTITRVNGDRVEIEDSSVEPDVQYLGKQKPKSATQNRIPTAGDVDQAVQANQSALNDASWAIKAKAETTAHALKSIVRPHSVISVEGAGALDDGSYFVRSVNHSLDATVHKMSIELVRNALGGS